MTKSFWDFSITTYGKEGVPAACLGLQDRLAVDVNVLLFCCWFGLSRGRIDKKLFAELLAAAELWASCVVRPLRSVRGWMKQEAYEQLRLPEQTVSSLREKIKSNELGAEKIQQELLASMVKDISAKELTTEEQTRSILDNIQYYCSALGIQIDDQSKLDLCHVLTASADNFEFDAINVALDQYF